MPDLGGITGGQDRFEERWAHQVAPKLAEVEAAGRIDEEAARRRLAEAAQRAAQEKVEAAARRLAQHFDPVELRLQDAKNLAASLCEPPPTQAEKVWPRAAACTHAQGALVAALVGLPAGGRWRSWHSLQCWSRGVWKGGWRPNSLSVQHS